MLFDSKAYKTNDFFNMSISERHKYVFLKYFGVNKHTYKPDKNFLESELVKSCEDIVDKVTNNSSNGPRIRKEFPHNGSSLEKLKYVNENLSFGLIPIKLQDSNVQMAMSGLYIGDNRQILEKISNQFFNPIKTENNSSFLMEKQVEAILKLMEDGEDVHLPRYEKGFPIKSLLHNNGEGVNAYQIKDKNGKFISHLKITSTLSILGTQNVTTGDKYNIVNIWGYQSLCEKIPKYILDSQITRSSLCPVNGVLLICGLNYKRYDFKTNVVYNYIDCITPLEIVTMKNPI